MAAKLSAAHSAYQRYTYSYQHHAAKTRGRLLANGVGFAVGGIVFVPVLVLFALWWLGSVEWEEMVRHTGGWAIAAAIAMIALPFVALLGFFYGVWLILKAIFGKCRVVACPFCGKKHALFREVRSYICEESGHVLRFSGEGTELVKVACPHCALEWAATRDGGDTRCFCCGARLTLSGGSALFSPAALLCPACEASNPDGSYFCRACGGTLSVMEPLAAPSKKVAEGYTLEATPDSEGMDPITVRAAPPIGLLYRATSRLNGVVAQANEQPDPTVPNLKLLREVRECLKQIEEAVIKRPEYAAQARTQLGCLTHIVARLLKGLTFPHNQESTLSEFMLLFKELPASFNGLASRVNAGADPSMSVAPWPTELITLKPTASANVNITTLVDETHLDDWVKRNSPDGPLTPMSAPVRIPDTHRPSIPAGWYPDPTDNRALCWWDGEQWQPATRHPTASTVTPPQTRAATCIGCGSELVAGTESCGECGIRVGAQASAAPPEVAPGGVERAAGPDQPMLTPPVPVPLPDQMPDDFGQQGPVTASAASQEGAEYQPAPSPLDFPAQPSEHVERKRSPLFATIGAGAALVIVAGVVLAPHWLQGNPSPTPAATNPATPSPTTATTNPATTSTSPGIGATIKVGDAPQGVALDSAGHTLYVANTGEVTGEYSVSVIDLTTWKVTATIPFQYTQPQDVAVDPSTHLLYVTLSDNTVSVIDTDTREAIATIAVNSPPFGLAVDPSTHTLYVSHLFNNSVSVIDTNTRKVTATIQVGDGPLGLALDPVRRALYVANTGQDTQRFTVSVVDVTTRKVTATIPSENNQPSAVAVNPSTHLLYVALPDSTVSVIDPTTRTVTDTIKAEDHATGLALDPDTQTLYATHRGSGTVSMIKLG